MIQRWALPLRRFSSIQPTANVLRRCARLAHMESQTQADEAGRTAEARERSAKKEKDKNKKDKQAKFELKKAKSAAAPAAGSTQGSKEKAKAVEQKAKEILPDYVEDTPVGEKKRTCPRGQACTGII